MISSPSSGLPERIGRGSKVILRGDLVGTGAGIGVGVLLGVAGLFFAGDDGGVGADGKSSLLSSWSLIFFTISELRGTMLA